MSLGSSLKNSPIFQISDIGSRTEAIFMASRKLVPILEEKSKGIKTFVFIEKLALSGSNNSLLHDNDMIGIVS